MAGRGDEVTEAWRGVARRSGFLGDPDPLFEPALAAYQRPDRHYHNAHHVADCLREFQAVRGACADADAVAAALLFHDCVYDPRRADNEERSATAAAKRLRQVGMAAARILSVEQMILATRHAAAPETADAATVVDIDLSILGQAPAVFDAYDASIRLEYAHVPDAAFAAGRAKVLRGFLGRPALFSTDFFRGRYEHAARENLDRAVRRWEDRSA